MAATCRRRRSEEISKEADSVPPSLLESSLEVLMKDFVWFQYSLRYLPPLLKSLVVKKMCKRGLVTDHNASMVLHEGILNLDLTDNDFGKTCLRDIANYCPKLVVLDLSLSVGCRNNINSSDLSQLFQACQRLQVVELRGCILLDDNGVNSLARSCSFLVSLSLSGCHMVTDKSVAVLSDRCQYLQVLDLSKTKVSDSGLYYLSKGKCATKLRELKVSRCINITDIGVDAILKHCTRLTLLKVDGCPVQNHISSNLCGKLQQLTYTVYY